MARPVLRHLESRRTGAPVFLEHGSGDVADRLRDQSVSDRSSIGAGRHSFDEVTGEADRSQPHPRHEHRFGPRTSQRPIVRDCVIGQAGPVRLELLHSRRFIGRFLRSGQRRCGESMERRRRSPPGDRSCEHMRVYRRLDARTRTDARCSTWPRHHQGSGGQPGSSNVSKNSRQASAHLWPISIHHSRSCGREWGSR